MLKEGEITKLTEEEQCRICSILCTAEYCMETTQQLQVKTLRTLKRLYLLKDGILNLKKYKV